MRDRPTGPRGIFLPIRIESMSHYHAVVWIDHREARVFHFSPTEVDKLVV